MHIARALGRVLRSALPPILVLALLAALIVSAVVHLPSMTANRIPAMLARDSAWNFASLLVLAVPLAAGLVASRSVVRPLRRMTDSQLAFLVSVALAALLGAVGLHHYLHAGRFPMSGRMLCFAGFVAWASAAAIGGLIATSGRSPRVSVVSSAIAVFAVAGLPLVLNVEVDAVQSGVLETEFASAGTPVAVERAPPDAIILVTLDTTRFDAIGYSGSGRTRTPTLDRLADEGAAYLQATTPTPLVAS